MVYRFFISHIVAIFFLVVIPLPVGAETLWKLPPGQTGDWSVESNWTDGVPNSDTDARIDNGGSATVSTSSTCRGLRIGSVLGNGLLTMNSGSLSLNYGNAFVGFASIGRVEQSGGTLSTPASLCIGQQSNGTGYYTMSGGDVSAQTETIAYYSKGYFTQTGGTNTASIYLEMASQAGSRASYSLGGTGVLSVGLFETIGNYGKADFTQSGGSHICSKLTLGNYGGSTGTYQLDAGQLLVSSGNEYVGYGGTGTFTQNGGTHTILGALQFCGTSTTKGTYNLNGGTLITNDIKLIESGIFVYNFGGGTLATNVGSTLSTSVPMTLSGTNGNANIDTTNGTITLAGVLSGIGGLNKLGVGTLTLSAANSYRGNTNVEGGTLSISNPFLNDQADVNISPSAKIDLNFENVDTIKSLNLDGAPLALGTWGSSLSHAIHVDDVHFSGAGMLNVTVPEPSILALLLAATLTGLLRWRRRR